MAFWLRLLGYNLAARRVGTGSGINGSIDSWELLEDVAPNRRGESLCRVWRTSAVARFWTDLDRRSIFLALCEVIGDPRSAKGEGDYSAGSPAEFELQMENFLLMPTESPLRFSIPSS